MEGMEVTLHGRYGSNATWEEYKLRYMEGIQVTSHGRYGSNVTWKVWK